MKKVYIKVFVNLQNVQETALFSGKIYTADKNFTRPPVATVATNSKSEADVCNLGIIICRSFEPGGECSVGAGSEYIISLLISSVNIFHYDGTHTASDA